MRAKAEEIKYQTPMIIPTTQELTRSEMEQVQRIGLELLCRQPPYTYNWRSPRSRDKRSPQPRGPSAQRKQKYTKKKDRKRRQKLRKLLQQSESIQRLKAILRRIYEKEATYEMIEMELLVLIEQVKDQGVFFEILNETITNFIEDLADSIRERLASYIDSYDIEDFMLQYENFQDCPDFFILLVDQLDSAYRQIQLASTQIQKAINTYVRACFKPSENQDYNLSRNTLNHLVNYHGFLKCAVICCQNFYGRGGGGGTGTSSDMAEKLRILLQVIQLRETEFAEEPCGEAIEMIDSENSTEEDYVKTVEKNTRRKKKSNNGRKKKKEVGTMDETQQVKEMQMDVKAIENMRTVQVTNINRLPCQFDDRWLWQIHQQLCTQTTTN